MFRAISSQLVGFGASSAGSDVLNYLPLRRTRIHTQSPLRSLQKPRIGFECLDQDLAVLLLRRRTDASILN